MRQKIREQCHLDRFGSGYRYIWTVDRNGKEINGIGAAPLYREAQEGDDVLIRICSRRSGNVLTTVRTSL